MVHPKKEERALDCVGAEEGRAPVVAVRMEVLQVGGMAGRMETMRAATAGEMGRGWRGSPASEP